MVGTGTGSEIRQPLGYAIVGGLALSQSLTLYTTHEARLRRLLMDRFVVGLADQVECEVSDDRLLTEDEPASRGERRYQVQRLLSGLSGGSGGGPSERRQGSHNVQAGRPCLSPRL